MNIFIHSIPNWIELTCLALFIGMVMSLLWVLPSKGSDTPSGHDALKSRMRLLLAVSALVMLTTAALDLLVRATEMSGDDLAEVFPDLPTVIFHTHYGGVWLIRIAVLAAMAILVFALKKYRDSRGLLLLFLVLGAIVCLTESATGHGADKGDFSISELTDWVHLLAVSAWGGGLFALSFAILPAFAAGVSHERALADAASRFSRIAGIAVIIIVLTGIYNAWLYVGSIDALIKASYGWTLIAKMVLLMVLLYVGASNRYVRVPRMRQAAMMPEKIPSIIGRLLAPALTSRNTNPEERTTEKFSRSVRFEAVLMIVMLFCAALLRHEVPAKHYAHQHEKGHIHPHLH